ncbi:MAG: tetratricopeptide repeat protein [Thermosynechococcaceae cyanobacterium MS004]|nr:tetratricopeptide repeat protein [Thermosynechococcaceae cyanobacterium MS004]
MQKTALFSFTPSLMDGETLEAIFVQREALAADLVARVRESVLTPTKLHTLLIGARGMGKTHLVSLVHHRILAMPDLKERLLIAWLREEEWGVTSFLDLLLRILRALAEADPTLEARMEALYELASGEAEAAGVRLLNECIGDRTLWLIAENLDDLFSGLGEPGQQHLRAFLQTYGNCTMLATSLRIFKGVQRRNAPFYGFFRPVHLNELSAAEAQQLLLNIAQLRQQTDLVNFLQTPTGQTRVKAVQHLAGGNPRIYIIFADFLTHQSLDELASPFMSLVDALTPYYQARMQDLSQQQRKIVELLCEKKYPLTVKTIAQRCFVTAQTASSQLKDLREKGYVKSDAIGRESFYEIAEPLMRVCLGLKKERGEPLRLMVDFLRVWYPKTELLAMQQALLMAPERSATVSRYLEQALNDGEIIDEDPRIQACLDEIQALFDQKDYGEALKIAEKLFQVRDSWVERRMYGNCLGRLERFEEAIASYDKALQIKPDDPQSWHARSDALYSLGRYEEAIVSCDKALQIQSDSDYCWDSFFWNNRGVALDKLGCHEEAIASYDKALRHKPDFYDAWYNRGSALNDLGRYKEAITSFDKALQLKSDDPQSWNGQGIALCYLGRYEEAITSFDKVLQLKSDDPQAWFNQGFALGNLGRTVEALARYEKALHYKPDLYKAWHNRGDILSVLGRNEEAINSFNKALEIQSDFWQAWWGKGISLAELGRYRDAIAVYNKALELNPDFLIVEAYRDIAVAHLSHWEDNTKVLKSLLKAGAPILSEFLEAVVQSLFTTVTGPQQWTSHIAQLVQALEGHLDLNELGAALIKTSRELTSEMISQAKATAWRDAWVEGVGKKPAFDLPLRLLTTALHYKQTPEDPRVLLELPSEERKILQQALGLTAEHPPTTEEPSNIA